MPKLKQLPPNVKTYPFKVKIVSVTYHSFTKKGGCYLARVRCTELSRSKDVNPNAVFNATIWMTKEQFEKKPIAHNDILLFSSNILWISKGEYEYRYYGKENLQKAGRKEIHADDKDRPYYTDKIYPWAVSVPEDEWKIYDKLSDEFVAKVGYDWEHCISIYFDSEEEMIDFDGGDFYLTNEEYDKLKNKLAETVKFRAYIYRNPIEPKRFYMQLEYAENVGKYIMRLTKSKKL